MPSNITDKIRAASLAQRKKTAVTHELE